MAVEPYTEEGWRWGGPDKTESLGWESLFGIDGWDVSEKEEAGLPVFGDWFGQWVRGAVFGGSQVLCLDYLLFQIIICNYCLHFLMWTSFLTPLNSGFYFHQSTKITHSTNISDFNVSKSNGFSFYSWAHSTYLEHPSPSVSMMT